MTRDEYLISLEKELQDPLKKISYEDVYPADRGLPFTVEFSRTAGTMSQRELFVLKVVMWRWQGELEDMPPDDSDAKLLIAVLYGDGKGMKEFKFRRKNITRGSAMEWEKFYFSDLKPMSVNEAFNETIEGIKLGSEIVSDTFFDRWCKAQLAGKHSGSRLAEATTLQDSRVFSTRAEPYNVPLGRMSDGSVVSYAGNRSLVTIAPPESGKTLSQALPALMSFAGHVVVLDIKGNLYEKTAHKRQQAFNSRIVNYNPTSAEAAHYNPLSLISDDPDDCFDEAMALAQLIVPERNERDHSWSDMGRSLLAVFIAYTVLTTAGKPERRTMSTVLDLVSGIGAAAAFALIGKEGSKFPDAMKRAAHDVLDLMKEDSVLPQFMGVKQAIKGGISIWNSSQVARASKRCDWSPEDLRSNQPLSLYLTIPFGDLPTYGPLIKVILAQHISVLLKTIPPTDALPILLLLDEFPQLGRMDVVKRAIEFGREYGIRTWLFAQFSKHFEDVYGRGGEGMIEICGVRMYMNPVDRDAETISKAFGNQTSMLSEKKEPILPADEIKGPAHRDSVFVLSSNETPLVLSKNFAAR